MTAAPIPLPSDCLQTKGPLAWFSLGLGISSWHCRGGRGGVFYPGVQLLPVSVSRVPWVQPSSGVNPASVELGVVEPGLDEGFHIRPSLSAVKSKRQWSERKGGVHCKKLTGDHSEAGAME